jgi:hypothetical protein
VKNYKSSTFILFYFIDRILEFCNFYFPLAFSSVSYFLDNFLKIKRFDISNPLLVFTNFPFKLETNFVSKLPLPFLITRLHQIFMIDGIWCDVIFISNDFTQLINDILVMMINFFIINSFHLIFMRTF